MTGNRFVIFFLILTVCNLPFPLPAIDSAMAGSQTDLQREIGRLQEKSPGAKLKALRTLAAMGELAAPAVPMVVELLDSNQRYVGIGDRIMNLFNPLGTSGIYLAQEARKTLVKIGQPAVDHLIAALRHSRPKVRGNAAQTLGDIHDLKAIKPLENALAGDPVPEVRMWSAEAIGSMASYWSLQSLEGTVPHLIRALDDESIDVCQHAADSLGRIKSEKAIQPLIKTLAKRGKNSGSGIALFMITGERFGDNPSKWQEWLDSRNGGERITR